MTVEAISYLAPQMPLPTLGPVNGVQATATPGFGEYLSGQLSGLNAELVQADRGLQGLAAGSETNLHQVMLKMEQAQLSLQLMLQVRNHLLDAYQEVLRMQV